MVKRRKSLGAEKDSKIPQENGDPNRVSGADGDDKLLIPAGAPEKGDTINAKEQSSKAGTGGIGGANCDGEGKTKVKQMAQPSDPAPPPRPTHQIATRSVTGRLKGRNKREASPPTSPVPHKKQATQKEPKAATNTPEPKARRQWELWGAADKDIFFKGLNEFGKDFDSIQHLVSQSIKKRSTESEPLAVKSKDQIRHFYYRTWHKISKHLDFDHEDDVSKQALELYGLINYGELRKKIGSKLDEKSGIKLRELVHKGTTTVKVKGTNRRIKTPVCKALKKLNHIDDNKDDDRYKMPEKVSLEMIPSCNKAWCQVQALAQNPRLRLRVATSTKIPSLVSYLNNKWKPDRVRMKEALGDIEKTSTKMILRPLSDAVLKPFVPKPIVTHQRPDLAFEAYKENIKNLTQAGLIGNNSPQNRKGSKAHSKSHNDDPTGKKSKETDQSNGVTSSSSSSSLSSLVSSLAPADLVSDNAIMETDTFFKLSNASAKETSATENKPSDPSDKNDKSKPEPVPESKEEAKVRILRNGLDCENSDSITVGDIFLIMGKPEKFTLRYEWKDLNPTPQILDFNDSVTNMLRRLVHLAKLEHPETGKKSKAMLLQEASSPPKHCTCGYYKNGSPPDKRNRNSPATRGGRSATTPKNSRRNNAGNKTPDTPKSGRKSGLSQPILAPKELLPSIAPASTAPIIHGGAGDSVFRVPTAAPPKATNTRQLSPNTQADHNLLQQIKLHKHPDFFMPRGRRQLKRNIRKPSLVVQRTLLPKTEVPNCQIMTLKVLPNTAQGLGTGSFLPVVTNPALAGIMGQPIPAPVSTAAGSVPPSIITMTPASVTKSATVRRIIPTPVLEPEIPVVPISKSSGADILKQAAAQANILSEDSNSNLTGGVSSNQKSTSNVVFSQAQAITGMDAFLSNLNGTSTHSSRDKAEAAAASASDLASRSPPPNISALLDLSLPAPPEISDSTDKLLDMALCNNSNSSFSALLDQGLSKTGDKDGSPPGSPMKFKGIPSLSSDMQWLNGEDFNLSNFLSDSPQKSRPAAASGSSSVGVPPVLSLPPGISLSDASRDSILGKLDVDSTMLNIMNENSLDYVSKFADLAAQVAATAKESDLENKSVGGST